MKIQDEPGGDARSNIISNHEITLMTVNNLGLGGVIVLKGT